MNELQEAREEQDRLRRVTERQNIERLQTAIDTAKAELREALLRRENRIMSQEPRE